jgi:hypothetical protein
MFIVWNTENRKLCLNIKIKCKDSGRKRFRCWIEDFDSKSQETKPNSKYADRTIKVEGGERMIYFSLPVTPKEMVIGVIDIDNPENKNFDVKIEESPLKTYNIWIDSETNNFLGLAVYFSQVCGWEWASPKGRLFKTPDNKFNIKYYPVITHQGLPISTPARIGHQTGVIEIAKNKFDNYTVAMRMIILLHEYSHKYRNPKINLKIENEFGADINALYIYLGLGFSKVDAIYVFANIFLKAQTDTNRERMKLIMDYIEKFEAEQKLILK